MKKGEGEAIRKLKLEDYEIGRILGKGGFGKVKVAKNKKTGAIDKKILESCTFPLTAKGVVSMLITELAVF